MTLNCQIKNVEECMIERNKIDKEHRTKMGNWRLFWQGETDWQNNLQAGWKEMLTTIKTWFKTNIYDSGASGQPGIPGRPMKIFGVEMKWPTLDFPTWQEIKDSLPAWLSSDWWSGKWDDWEFTWPSWSDITASLPKWLGGTKEDKTQKQQS